MTLPSVNAMANGGLTYTTDQILALLEREDRYLCEDYSAGSYCQQQQQQQQQRDDCDSMLHKVPSASSFRDVQADERRSTTMNEEAKTTVTAEFTVWRHQMFDWACMVVDRIGADRETVAWGFSLLDRFLVTELKRSGCVPPMTCDDYQLFAMTCLYIATKVLDPYPNKLSVDVLVDLSKQYYTRQVIEQMEIDILSALEWKIHSTTALTYARLYAELLQQHQPTLVLQASQLLTTTEIAVSSGCFYSCRPSIVGLAAVLLAVHNGPPDQVQDFLMSHAELLPKDGDQFRHVYTQLEKLCS